MTTGFNTQIIDGMFHLQFETDKREYYEYVQAAARDCLDGKATDKYHRWISVEERLPEENGEYLVCYKMIGYKHKLVRVRQYECGFGFWVMTPPSEGFDQVMVEGVTHWMPLPKLPEVTKT